MGGAIWPKSMPYEAAEAMAELFNDMEGRCAWPIHVLMNIIVLMGKPPPGGVRPIALMPMIYIYIGCGKQAASL